MAKKGGAGKTFLTKAIGAELAKTEKRNTLLLDMDTQGNLSTELIQRSTNDIYKLLSGEALESIPIMERLMLVASGPKDDFAVWDSKLSDDDLSSYLDASNKDAPHFILDTKDSDQDTGMLRNARYMCDSFLICMRPDPSSYVNAIYLKNQVLDPYIKKEMAKNRKKRYALVITDYSETNVKSRSIDKMLVSDFNNTKVFRVRKCAPVEGGAFSGKLHTDLKPSIINGFRSDIQKIITWLKEKM